MPDQIMIRHKSFLGVKGMKRGSLQGIPSKARGCANVQHFKVLFEGVSISKKGEKIVRGAFNFFQVLVKCLKQRGRRIWIFY